MATATLERPAVRHHVRTCLYCEKRFVPKPDASLVECPGCLARMARDRAATRAQRAKLDWRTDLRLAIHWRGYCIGLYPHATKAGVFRSRALLGVELADLPKGRVNLDEFCPEYDRDQVRRFKGAIKRAHRLMLDPAPLPAPKED